MATSPTVRQRELGMRLREIRSAKGLTVEEVAKELLCSPTKVSRMETGARRQSLRDVRDLCQLYELGPETSAELMELTRQARQPGWWTEFDDTKVYYPFIGLEQDATAITAFGMYFVPALLQTPDYARALVRGIVPKIGADVLEERVKVRMRRQELLSTPAVPRYRALIDEAVLRRQVGGADVMKAQLEHLALLAEGGRVNIQVIPFGAGAYAAADSNFDFLEFGGSDLPDLVVVEGLTQQTYLERAADIERYGESLEYLRDTAMNLKDSVKLIREVGREHAEATGAS
jgi:transcriptional regulator with XRE-family HTH domain